MCPHITHRLSDLLLKTCLIFIDNVTTSIMDRGPPNTKRNLKIAIQRSPRNLFKTAFNVTWIGKSNHRSDSIHRDLILLLLFVKIKLYSLEDTACKSFVEILYLKFSTLREFAEILKNFWLNGLNKWSFSIFQKVYRKNNPKVQICHKFEE